MGIVSIYTYGIKKGLDRLNEANVKNVSLTDFDTTISVAVEIGYIKPEDEKRLKLIYKQCVLKDLKRLEIIRLTKVGLKVNDRRKI